LSSVIENAQTFGFSEISVTFPKVSGPVEMRIGGNDYRFTVDASGCVSALAFPTFAIGRVVKMGIGRNRDRRAKTIELKITTVTCPGPTIA
jgi:hypothetical protein